jgi:hypothetical protein
LSLSFTYPFLNMAVASCSGAAFPQSTLMAPWLSPTPSLSLHHTSLYLWANITFSMNQSQPTPCLI